MTEVNEPLGFSVKHCKCVNQLGVRWINTEKAVNRTTKHKECVGRRAGAAVTAKVDVKCCEAGATMPEAERGSVNAQGCLVNEPTSPIH
jgi:hypothetical protein